MKAIGCSDPKHKQDDGFCYCNECSMADDELGNDSKQCKDFRKIYSLRLEYA